MLLVIYPLHLAFPLKEKEKNAKKTFQQRADARITALQKMRGNNENKAYTQNAAQLKNQQVSEKC